MTWTPPKTILRGATLALSCLTGAICPLALDSIISPPALAQSVGVDIAVFFDELAPHGRWVQSQRHGFVFLPANINSDWRPYELGRWAYTDDYGWYWVADEPFGWATYHYGRWGYDGGYGWFWVPGNVWAPAWVTWRSSDDYIGWAPLPPPNRGYAFAASIGPVDVGIGAWHFVKGSDFLAPNLATVVIERRRNGEIFRNAQPLGSVRVVNNVVVNTVVNIQRIERVTNRQVVVHRINDRDHPGRADVTQNSISAYRQNLSTAQPRQRPNNAGRADQIANSPRAADSISDARGREQGQRARQEVEPSMAKGGGPIAGSGETGKQGEPKGTTTAPRDGGDGTTIRQAEPKGGKGEGRDGAAGKQAEPKGSKGEGRDGTASRPVEPKGGKDVIREDAPGRRQADPKDRSGPGRAVPDQDGRDNPVAKGAGRGGGSGGSQSAGGRSEGPPPGAGRGDEPGGPGGGGGGGQGRDRDR